VSTSGREEVTRQILSMHFVYMCENSTIKLVEIVLRMGEKNSENDGNESTWDTL
jgi:hypothetical protein